LLPEEIKQVTQLAYGVRQTLAEKINALDKTLNAQKLVMG